MFSLIDSGGPKAVMTSVRGKEGREMVQCGAHVKCEMGRDALV